MGQLVILKGQELFTTSDIIAEFAQVSYRAVQDLIEKHEQRLSKSGVLTFEMSKPKTGRPKKIYLLNEPQALKLVTYLKNTEPVLDFKDELVQQFIEMRKILTERQSAEWQYRRAELKPIRKEMVAMVKHYAPGTWSYKNFTNLSYLTALGKNAEDIRMERGAKKKAVAVDFMTSQEIAEVTKKQDQIALLLDLGLGYHEIKELLNRRKQLVS